MTSGVDLFSAVPDDVLQHVLSFLPSRDAVQASVISRRWRHLWRSTPAFRAPDQDDGRPYHAFRMFVNRFLLLRDSASPLRTFEVDVGHEDDTDEDDVDMWIRHATLTCRTLHVANSLEGWTPRLTSGPITNAQHLTTLRLCSVRLDGDFLDLSRCPALLHLSLSNCHLDCKCKAVVSRSLRRLSVTDCSSSGTTTSMRISTPSLRWLHLAEPPSCLLESMPSLTAATVLLSRGKLKDCSNRSVLLEALSEATSLELMASSSYGQAILHGELRWCPTFSSLKTLVLNEWCIYDESVLAYLLSHSPILEKLSFEISEKSSYKYKAARINVNRISEMKTFEHLKVVEVNCQVVGRRVFKILRLLSACGIPLAKISIQGSFSKSECFSFAFASLSFEDS